MSMPDPPRTVDFTIVSSLSALRFRTDDDLHVGDIGVLVLALAQLEHEFQSAKELDLLTDGDEKVREKFVTAIDSLDFLLRAYYARGFDEHGID